MAGTTPYSIPDEPGRWRAITLAVIMHALLFVCLWLGISWQSQTPIAVEAEVWNLNTKEAAPRVAPQPEPVAKPPEPKVIEKEVPVEKPDIALEREKKRKEKEKEARLEEERLQKEKEKADALAKKKEEVKKKRQQDIETAKLAEKLRKEDEQRLFGGTGGSGKAARNESPVVDASYIQKLQAKIRSNTDFPVPPDLQGNPAVEFTVELFPDGSVKKIKKQKPSGIQRFDDAVERAIDKSAPYPPDKSGIVPQSFSFAHTPKPK